MAQDRSVAGVNALSASAAISLQDRRRPAGLFDEPTENLDADQRARLTGVIRGYPRDRTCMVISHDMDFIAAVADRILVLEHGRIAQMGDHHTLMAEGGLYKRLYEAQNAGASG